MANLDLVSFNESLLPLNHWTKCFNSQLIIDSIVPNFLHENIRLVSSAKWWRIENTHCRSFTHLWPSIDLKNVFSNFYEYCISNWST